VNVSGRITFDRVPFFPGPNTGLNFAGTTQAPARGVVVEALPSSNTSATPLATAITDASGAYSFALPKSTGVVVRAKAQMSSTAASPTWNFQVLNNANSDALYVLDSSAFDTGTADISQKDLNAASGWDLATSSYPDPTKRAAAPFAILDDIYTAVQLITTAQPQIAFPALNVFWSTANKDDSNSGFCPASGNSATGNILTTSFHSGDVAGACVSALESQGGIYVLGFLAGNTGDTDEFDTHVIAHEFGHYIEHSFSRADSQGGNHSLGNKLDLRVAMSEGWGNAFSGMVFNDPVYRDSRITNGAPQGFSFNVSSPDTTSTGWYSEGTVQYVLWNLFGGSSANVGFAPIFRALKGKQKTTPAFTSIFTFLDAIETVSPSSAGAITALANSSGINSVDPFAVGETNDGGDSTVLPVYNTFTPPTMNVCSTLPAGEGGYNKLGNRKFFKIVTAASGIVSVSLTATSGSGVAATDPDFLLWSAGALRIDGTNGTGPTESASATLPAGTYVLEVYDYAYNNPANDSPVNDGPHCMTVTVTTP
jgi:hypothetical protein